MSDQKPRVDHGKDAAKAPDPAQTTPASAAELEQRRQQVQREAKENGAGANDPDEPVNQDG